MGGEDGRSGGWQRRVVVMVSYRWREMEGREGGGEVGVVGRRRGGCGGQWCSGVC